MADILPKCFTHLQNKGFFSLTIKANRIKELATFGIIVRNNFEKCLHDFNRNVDKFTVFPVAGIKSMISLNEHLFHGRRLDKFGITFSSTSSSEDSRGEPEDELKVWSSTRPCNNLVIFCDPNQSLNLFYSLQSIRYRWWRKLSVSPSHFQQSTVQKCKITNEEDMSINYKSPLIDDKTLCLENIKYITNDTQINNILGTPLTKHLIWCKMFPDNAAISYLIDGCSVDDSDEFKEMGFNELLVPYHVAFTIKSSQDSTINTRLDEIADYLIKDLKEYGITVFPFKYRSFSLDNKSYQRFDGIGIPYTVSLTEESLQLGVIGLRNKDTKLEESVHITRLKISLLLYLKLMKPLDIKLAIMESQKTSQIKETKAE